MSHCIELGKLGRMRSTVANWEKRDKIPSYEGLAPCIVGAVPAPDVVPADMVWVKSEFILYLLFQMLFHIEIFSLQYQPFVANFNEWLYKECGSISEFSVHDLLPHLANYGIFSS